MEEQVERKTNKNLSTSSKYEGPPRGGGPKVPGSPRMGEASGVIRSFLDMSMVGFLFWNWTHFSC